MSEPLGPRPQTEDVRTDSRGIETSTMPSGTAKSKSPTVGSQWDKGPPDLEDLVVLDGEKQNSNGEFKTKTCTRSYLCICMYCDLLALFFKH